MNNGPSDDDITTINWEDRIKESLRVTDGWSIDQAIKEFWFMDQTTTDLTLFHFVFSLSYFAMLLRATLTEIVPFDRS
jgi:hypothetical protein